jgi:predicted metal-binding membrane protein
MSGVGAHGVAGVSPVTPGGGIGLWPGVRDDRLFFGLMALLILLAWLSLWLWHQSPHSRFLSHEEIAGTESLGEGYLTLLALFVAGWTVMTVAMMLPTSLPLVAFFRTFVRTRPNRVSLVSLLVIGYVGVWAAFAGLIHFGDIGVHETVARIGWLEANAWTISAATFLFAGAYQFTALKYRCLDKCRSPVSFVMQNWRGGRERWDAFRLGVHHGIFCLGCCWSLMLLMFAVGVGNIAWMLVLAVVMATEKNMPWGRRLSAPLGIVLIGSGLILVLAGALGVAAL